MEIKFGDSNNLNANKAIKQIIRVMKEHEKPEALKAVIKELNPGGNPAEVPKTIIFVSRKHSCDDLANQMWNDGYSVDSLHGDKQQFQRTRVMDQFKKGQLKILIATDVAARGLDVKDIECVINYDFPGGQNGVEDYVHRIVSDTPYPATLLYSTLPYTTRLPLYHWLLLPYSTILILSYITSFILPLSYYPTHITRSYYPSHFTLP